MRGWWGVPRVAALTEAAARRCLRICAISYLRLGTGRRTGCMVATARSAA